MSRYHFHYWTKFSMAGHRCVDCRVNTDEIAEYYMVQFDLWESAGMDPDGGMLCIGCLEERLGRELVGADFLDAPINKGYFPRSDRFLARLAK